MLSFGGVPPVSVRPGKKGVPVASAQRLAGNPGTDPLAAVSNLPTFVFGMFRAIDPIILGFGVVQVGLSLKSHDPSCVA
nr:hypothetical protein [Paraeggerthella hongkongensis]